MNLVTTADNGATESMTGKPIEHVEVMRHFAPLCGDATRIMGPAEWRAWVLRPCADHDLAGPTGRVAR